MKIKEITKKIFEEFENGNIEYKPFEYQEAKELIQDFLDEAIFYDIKDTKDLVINRLEDIAIEYADGQVDIYYSDIYASLPRFADSVNEAIAEGLCEENETIDKQIQSGQYYAYENLFRNVLSVIDNELAI